MFLQVIRIPIKQRREKKRGSNEHHAKAYKANAKDGDQNEQTKQEKHCYYHDCNGHELTGCKVFETKSFEEKMEWLKSTGLCFRCLSGKHRAKDCKKEVKCTKCDSLAIFSHCIKKKKRRLKKRKTGRGSQIKMYLCVLWKNRRTLVQQNNISGRVD